MRVLHVFDHSLPIVSEYSGRGIQFIKEQRRQGIETIQVTGVDHDLPFEAIEEVDGIEFHRCKKSHNLISKLPVFKQKMSVNILQKKIEEIVVTESIDIIHAHSPSINGLAALKVGQKYKVPIHYDVRSFIENDIYVMEQATYITAASDALKADMIERGIDGDKIAVIPDFIDMEEYQERFEPNKDLQERMNILGMTIIGYVGPFDEVEGVDILIRSMRSLLFRVPNACLLLVGSGPEQDELIQLAERMMLGDRVILTGEVPHHKLIDYYNLIDIMVYGRRSVKKTEIEPFIKVLTAQAMKKNVIASDIGGHREFIKDGKTGLLFKPGDPIALADKIVNFIEKPKRYCDAAIDNLLQKHDIKKTVKKYRDIYQNEL